jgi:hypothetical protein
MRLGAGLLFSSLGDFEEMTWSKAESSWSTDGCSRTGGAGSSAMSDKGSSTFTLSAGDTTEGTDSVTLTSTMSPGKEEQHLLQILLMNNRRQVVKEVSPFSHRLLKSTIQISISNES